MYSTELTEKIITSDEARKILNHVSPIYGDSYVGLWLFQIIGSELDDIKLWSEELKLQTSIQTATWSLPYWEREYDITPDADWNVEQRRLAVISKMRYKAPMNPKKLSEIASVFSGVPVDIAENTGKNKFSVYVRKNISVFSFFKAKAAIDRAKPAHLIYDIQITEIRESYVDIKSAVNNEIIKKYKVEVV